jgi:hypothetical protein
VATGGAGFAAGADLSSLARLLDQPQRSGQAPLGSRAWRRSWAPTSRPGCRGLRAFSPGCRVRVAPRDGGSAAPL